MENSKGLGAILAFIAMIIVGVLATPFILILLFLGSTQEANACPPPGGDPRLCGTNGNRECRGRCTAASSTSHGSPPPPYSPRWRRVGKYHPPPHFRTP